MMTIGLLAYSLFCVMAQVTSLSVDEYKRLPKYNLPEISYNQLVTLDESTILQLAQDMITLGAVQITDIPNYKKVREDGLEHLAECLSNGEGITEVIMNDNTKRMSTAARAMHGTPTPMNSPCGDAASGLRSAVDVASRQLLLSLDAVVAMRGNDNDNVLLSNKYNTFESIHSNGDHLEHLHAFVKPNDVVDSPRSLFVGDTEDEELTMPMHTDSGLMIAMTSGLYKDAKGKILSSNEIENGLYMTLNTGSVVKVVTKDDSLIIMMGQGAASWLEPKLGQQIRAVPHALLVDIGGVSTSRAWFGKMYLPPTDAISERWGGSTFATFTASTEKASEVAIVNGERYMTSLPAACGSSMRITKSDTSSNKASHDWISLSGYMLSNTLCADGDGVMCWTNCYTGSDLPSCGTQAECVDPATGANHHIY